MSESKSKIKSRRYSITRFSWYDRTTLLLVLLFVTAFILWFIGYTLAVLILALTGLIITVYARSKGKKIIGNTINIGETGISIHALDTNREIAFADIQSVKINKILGLGETTIVLMTRDNDKVKIVPQHYEDGNELQADLQEAFSRRKLI